MLKVIRHQKEEWHSGALLAAFGGAGLIRPLEFADGAVLLPRLQPGRTLTTLVLDGRDDEATGILAGVIGRMAAVRPAVAALPVESMVDEFDLYRHTCDGLMPDSMVAAAERLFAQLAASQSDVRVVHGDLHHCNVLFDRVQGWLAIDPQGIAAELEYEVGASLRNPIDAPAVVADSAVAARRLDIYCARLGLKRERALGWAFAQAVLAALWPVAKGGTDMRPPFIAAARAMWRLIA